VVAMNVVSSMIARMIFDLDIDIDIDIDNDVIPLSSIPYSGSILLHL